MVLSLKEIADLAGVSQATASRVINHSRGVRPLSRTKVESVLAQHTYAPDPRAVSLARGDEAWPSVVITLPRTLTPHFLAVLDGVREGFSGKKVHLVIREEEANQTAWRDSLLASGPAGFLVLCRGLSQAERDYYHTRRIPYAILDFESKGQPCLVMNNHKGGEIAADYLFNKGVRRPYYIGTPGIREGVQNSRWQGFSGYYESKGLSVNTFEIPSEGTSQGFMEAGYKAVKELGWRDLSTSPDGIFFFCDEMALGGVKALREMDIFVPVIGYDGWVAAPFAGIATVKQPAKTVGLQGAEVLLKMLGGLELPEFPLVFEPELVGF